MNFGLKLIASLVLVEVSGVYLILFQVVRYGWVVLKQQIWIISRVEVILEPVMTHAHDILRRKNRVFFALATSLFHHKTQQHFGCSYSSYFIGLATLPTYFLIISFFCEISLALISALEALAKAGPSFTLDFFPLEAGVVELLVFPNGKL